MNSSSSVAVIGRDVDGVLVSQRAGDGYVNATELCKAAGKRLTHYLANSTTKKFLGELSSVAGIPATELIQIRQGGDAVLQGTWVHPDVAIHLAQWCSAKFAVMVSRWVRELLTTGSVGVDAKRIDRLEDQVGQIATALTGFAGVVGGLVESVKVLVGQHGQQPAIGRQGQQFSVADRCRFNGWLGASKNQRNRVRQKANAVLRKLGDVPDISEGSAEGSSGTCLYSGYQLIVLDNAISEIRLADERKFRESGPSLFNRTAAFASN